MKLTREQFARVRAWILRNGRPVDAARYACLFEGGSREEALRLLALYQNEDGGFGRALEPDLWNPDSTPYATSVAIGRMAELGATDAAHPMVRGVLRYLRGGAGFDGRQWPFSVPENDAYPCAPWWNYNPEANGTEGVGLTAELAAFILRTCAEDDPLYAQAKDIARRTLEFFMSGEKGGEMALGGYGALMEHWARLGLARDMDAVAARLRAAVDGAIVRDSAQWTQYVPRPSAAIRSPESPFYAGNEAAIDAELDWYIETLPEDDVWPINWAWFGTRHTNAFAISENWWKAIRAIDTLCLLRGFDRIER